MPRTSNTAGGRHNEMSLTPHYTNSGLLKFISGTKKEQLKYSGIDQVMLNECMKKINQSEKLLM